MKPCREIVVLWVAEERLILTCDRDAPRGVIVCDKPAFPPVVPDTFACVRRVVGVVPCAHDADHILVVCGGGKVVAHVAQTDRNGDFADGTEKRGGPGRQLRRIKEISGSRGL